MSKLGFSHSIIGSKLIIVVDLEAEPIKRTDKGNHDIIASTWESKWKQYLPINTDVSLSLTVLRRVKVEEPTPQQDALLSLLNGIPPETLKAFLGVSGAKAMADALLKSNGDKKGKAKRGRALANAVTSGEVVITKP